MHFKSSSVKAPHPAGPRENFWRIPTICATLVAVRRMYPILVTLMACHDKTPEPLPPPPPQDGVVLIQPGVPPLQMLRYHLTRGATVKSRLVCNVDVKSSELQAPMPSQVLDLETVVEDVLAGGDARLRITVVDADIRDRPGAAATDVVKAQTAALRGVVVTETLAPDGKVSDAQVTAGAAPDRPQHELDALLQNLARVATRLPAEPVGVGATWRERRTLPEGGVRAVSEITYTLTSLAGTAVGFTSAGQASGPPQTVDQDGEKVEVTDTHGQSAAAGSLDLSRYALELTATSAFSTTMALAAPDAGRGAERSTIEISIAIRMTSAQGAHSAP